MARLIFRDSQGREGTVELSPTEPVFVGRGLDCAVRTDDGMVSRRHAQFRAENGRFVVEDLGSSNGTHLNNVRIQKHPLGHSDVIQCGSLVIRYLDDVPAAAVPQQNAGGAVPPKKGGTMVLDRNAASDGTSPPPFGSHAPQAPAVAAAPYGAPPAMPAASAPPNLGSSSPNLPYGGPPSMPGVARGGFGGSAAGAGSSAAAAAPLPYGGPPSIPGIAPPPAPYGGPPAMPADRGSSPSVFGRGGPAMAAPAAALQRPPIQDADKKVLIDLGLEADPKRLEREIDELKAEVEVANANYEREVADGKRVRAESATLRDRIEELRAAVKDREDQVAAHDRVSEQLRDELQQTRDEYNKLRGEMSELAENMAARERQAARSQDDAAKVREDMQDLNRQLMELSRTKDEGWKKLNDQLTEIEHLREVINEQERMLEERRVGLISQEEVIKELRGDKERTLKQVAALKAERDETATEASRTAAQLVAVEEENKRLGRLLVESQTEAGRISGDQGDHMMRLAGELKDLRVEYKKIEADRERLSEQHQLAERDRVKLEGKLAQVEVELQEAVHAKLAADSARGVAADALAKSEVARAKAAEEALASAKARDQAGSAGDDARRELDKLRRRVAELEKAGAPRSAAVDPAELQRERDAGQRKVAEVTARAEQAERSIRSLEVALEAAKTDAQKARAEAARARAAADAHAESVIDAVSPPPGRSDLARRAKDVYDAINDILSEMRNNMILVQGELPNLKSHSRATLQAVADAVEALVDGAETAKGALRGLRDLAESK
jgi:hypothetical protein